MKLIPDPPTRVITDRRERDLASGFLCEGAFSWVFALKGLRVAKFFSSREPFIARDSFHIEFLAVFATLNRDYGYFYTWR